MPTNISITFKGGLGSVTAKLFRSGILVDKGTADKTGTIILKDTVKDDCISINGVSPPGGTDITISVTTDPPTTIHCNAGPILRDFDVL